MKGPETNQVSNPKPQQQGNYPELFIRSVERNINLFLRDKFRLECFPIFYLLKLGTWRLLMFNVGSDTSMEI